MRSSPVYIKNKLEIQPGKHGGLIKIPGCEPTTSVTDDTLSRNLHCKSSFVYLKDALRLIPGSRVVFVTMPVGNSGSGTGRWFELPSGPPPNWGCDCTPDWYKILRQGHHDDDDDLDDEKCAGFNFTGCKGPNDDDYVKPYRKVYDPDFHDHEDRI